METTLEKATPETAVGKPAVVTLEKFQAFATKLAAVVPSLRFKIGPSERELLKTASALTVTDSETCGTAGVSLVAVKRLKRAAEAHYDLLKRPFNTLMGVIRDCEKADVTPLDTLASALDRRIIGWRREEKDRERQDQARLQAEEDQRAKARHEAQVQAVQRVAEQTTDLGLRASLQAEAASLADAPIAVATVAVESQIPVVAGLGFTKRYKGELQGDASLLKFVKAIGSKKIPLQAAIGIKEIKGRPKVWESPFLNDQIKAHGGELGWPGVTVVEEEGTVGR